MILKSIIGRLQDNKRTQEKEKEEVKQYEKTKKKCVAAWLAVRTRVHMKNTTNDWLPVMENERRWAAFLSHHGVHFWIQANQ